MLAKGTHVVVFTKWQSIYFGELENDFSGEEEFLVLLNSRHGFDLNTTEGAWEICSSGPGPKAQIGPKVPRHMVLGVANVAVPSKDAVEKWQKAKWSNS